MDRRVRKSRKAILDALSSLLSEKSYSRISVQEIIERADVARTTFYAHFETKDDTAKALCSNLFTHVIQSAIDIGHSHGTYSNDAAPDSVFWHLLEHLKENENNILGLLKCESNEMFLRYFKESLNALVLKQYGEKINKIEGIDHDFLTNHISSSFVELVFWWIKNDMKKTSEEMDRYFSFVIREIVE